MNHSRDPVEVLLELQACDTSVDQLRYRRGALPQLERLAALQRRSRNLSVELKAETVRRDEVIARQRSSEAELGATERRLAGLEQRLYSGTVTVARDLQAMEAERDSLRRRVGVLEEEVLAAMTEVEPLDRSIEALNQEEASIASETARLQAEADDAQSDIDGQLSSVVAGRAALVGDVPPELLGLYEKLRTRLGGVGIASLTNGRCGGCHLALSATEMDNLHKQLPGTVAQCEQCTRILVPAR